MVEKNANCKYCSYAWTKMVDNPLQCPRCKRYFDLKAKRVQQTSQAIPPFTIEQPEEL